MPKSSPAKKIKKVSPVKKIATLKSEAKKVVRKRKSVGPEENMGCLSSKRQKKEDDNVVKVSDSKQTNDTKLLDDWNHVDYVCSATDLSKPVAQTVLQLFDNDNTIPFIARYRKSQTGGLDADKLRAVKESYDRSKAIKHKAELVIKSIDKSGKGSSEVYNAVKSAKTLNELEDIHALYKTGSKRTLAERARELGLGPKAEAVLRGDKIPHLRYLIDLGKDGLEGEDEVREGIICIIADMICKDKNTFEKIKELRQHIPVKIETIKSTKTDKTENSKTGKKNEVDKYKTYYNWMSLNKNIKPYQILAINRAEKEKVISVQVSVPDNFEMALKRCILDKFQLGVGASPFHNTLINKGFSLAYKKSIKPAIIRRTRSEMSERAEEASMEVFAKNVKELLLKQPVRGKKVLGIDPGYANGCKIAVVSEQGNVLETTTIYPHKTGGKVYQDWSKDAANTLGILTRRHKISTIALGGATACRETEEFICDLIKSGILGKEQVQYTIVDEAGASIYSCTPEAKSEFPKLDYNVISAISIARRLQDPLAELVKVEPKHLGVGMYQHDLPEKQLVSKLNEVVTEVVSFVGVDVNTASHTLLRRVAGLSETRAANIIKWRKENGPFINRMQLLKVKGIGPKSFEQCAGFIRILPETAVSSEKSKASKKFEFNHLDQTWIHPESYKIANEFIKLSNLNLEDLGTRSFIHKVNEFVSEKNFDQLTEKLRTNTTTLNIIYKGLKMEKGEDIRLKNNAPLFRNSLRSIHNLNVGSLLTGEVRNVTDFGAFIDIGVGRNGLIHWKYLEGNILEVGQRVSVKVMNVEIDRGRIALDLV